jgi:hypothetical protein
LHFSDHAAKAAGLEPKQYQLLRAIKGLPNRVAIKHQKEKKNERSTLVSNGVLPVVRRDCRSYGLQKTCGGCNSAGSSSPTPAGTGSNNHTSGSACFD